MKILSERERSAMQTQGARDLLTAGWLGEQMFAQLGLHRAVSVLDDPCDRTRVIAQAWKAERPFNLALAAGLVSASVLQLVRDRERGSWRDRRQGVQLDVAASACALGAVGLGLGCALAGRVVSHASHGQGTPIRTGFTSMPETPRTARNAQHVLQVLAPASMVLGLASLALSVVARSRT